MSQSLELPSAGYQSVVVETADDGGRPSRVLVTVNLQAPVAATAAELADAAFTGPSAMVDSSDPVLFALAAKARGRTAGELAWALRELVFDHIETKDLTTAFASASEVARTRAGDCTEHAVLLAALLRARSIPAVRREACPALASSCARPRALSLALSRSPSLARPLSLALSPARARVSTLGARACASPPPPQRVCHGLVYVERYEDETETATGASLAAAPDANAGRGGEGVEAQFGWHMWTQALINGAWHDLDATLQVRARSLRRCPPCPRQSCPRCCLTGATRFQIQRVATG